MPAPPEQAAGRIESIDVQIWLRAGEGDAEIEQLAGLGINLRVRRERRHRVSAPPKL
jgi:hypothetical protein